MKDLARKLGMSLSLFSVAGEAVLTKTPMEDSAIVLSQIDERIALLEDFVQSGESKLEYQGGSGFKELYAHGCCYIFFESIFDVFTDLGFDAEGILLVEGVDVVHYILSVTMSSGEVVYVDAYGFYRNIADIESRYTETTITERRTFHPYSEDECDDFMDEYRNLFISLYDEIEGVVFDKFGVADMHDMPDYHQLFYRKQVLGLFQYLSGENDEVQAA